MRKRQCASKVAYKRFVASGVWITGASESSLEHQRIGSLEHQFTGASVVFGSQEHRIWFTGLEHQSPLWFTGASQVRWSTDSTSYPIDLLIRKARVEGLCGRVASTWVGPCLAPDEHLDPHWDHHQVSSATRGGTVSKLFARALTTSMRKSKSSR